MTKFVIEPRLKTFVDQQVDQGKFHNANEVINEAVRLLMAESEDLRREVTVGISQADRGDFVKFTATSIKTAGRKSLKGKGR